MEEFNKNRKIVATLMSKLNKNMDFTMTFIFYNNNTKNYECYQKTYKITSKYVNPNFMNMYIKGNLQMYDHDDDFIEFLISACKKEAGKINDWTNLMEHINYVYNDNISTNLKNKCIERLNELKNYIVHQNYNKIQKEWPTFDSRGNLKLYKNISKYDIINNIITKHKYFNKHDTDIFTVYKIELC
jgi:hypothetical protein